MRCLFVSDVHGDREKYASLFSVVKSEGPDAVFLGGDLLPHISGRMQDTEGFLKEHLFEKIVEAEEAAPGHTRFFVIMGNDDPRAHEVLFLDADREGVIEYVHGRTARFENMLVKGYSYVPPTPFLLKDWERYDVSRFVDPGGVSPEEGFRTVKVSKREIRYHTISSDLRELAGEKAQDRTIFLFHSPPYGSGLDRIEPGGRMIDHAPMDDHVGSIAIQRFIKERQPMLTLHGHIHESPGLTGIWKERTGETFSFSAAHDGPELAIVRFDTHDLSSASRELV